MSHAPPHLEMWVDLSRLVIVKPLAIAHVGPSQGEVYNYDCIDTDAMSSPTLIGLSRPAESTPPADST
jgi:hypothetical protein